MNHDDDDMVTMSQWVPHLASGIVVPAHYLYGRGWPIPWQLTLTQIMMETSSLTPFSVSYFPLGMIIILQLRTDLILLICMFILSKKDLSNVKWHNKYQKRILFFFFFHNLLSEKLLLILLFFIRAYERFGITKLVLTNWSQIAPIWSYLEAHPIKWIAFYSKKKKKWWSFSFRFGW